QRIDLHRVHRRARGEQTERQRAEPRPDFQHHVVAADPGQLHDAAHRVGVVHEVLTELLGRPDPELVGQPADVRRSQECNGHRRSLITGARTVRGDSARQAQLGRTGRPGTVAAARIAHLGRDGDLLFPAGLVRVRRVRVAAVGVPGALVELKAAVVAVAGVDRPVAAGLTLGQLVPHARVVDLRHLGADLDDPLLGLADDRLGDLFAVDLDVVLLRDPVGHQREAGLAFLDDLGLARLEGVVLDLLDRRLDRLLDLDGERAGTGDLDRRAVLELAGQAVLHLVLRADL